MAKVTDLDVVYNAAYRALYNEGCVVLDYLTIEEAARAMTLIYVTNDMVTGFGQDYTNNIHILSSPTRIAIIYQGHHSYYKTDGNICQYEDLCEDIEAIRVTLDVALARWEAL